MHMFQHIFEWADADLTFLLLRWNMVLLIHYLTRICNESWSTKKRCLKNLGDNGSRLLRMTLYPRIIRRVEKFWLKTPRVWLFGTKNKRLIGGCKLTVKSVVKTVPLRYISKRAATIYYVMSKALLYIHNKRSASE